MKEVMKYKFLGELIRIESKENKNYENEAAALLHDEAAALLQYSEPQPILTTSGWPCSNNCKISRLEHVMSRSICDDQKGMDRKTQ